MDPTQQQTPPSYSKESLIRRYKPIWRILLISNLALGGTFSVVSFVLMLYSFNVCNVFDEMTSWGKP